MLKFTLKSGKKIALNLANLDQCFVLLQTLALAAANSDLDLKEAFTEPLGELITKNAGAILKLFANPNVIEAIEDCCSKVSYDSQPYSKELFENEECRGDYIPLLTLVCCENIRPFFGKAPLWCTVIESLILQSDQK